MSLLVSTGSVCFFVVEVLDMADYHIKENRYDLPYDFLTKTVSL